MPENKPFLTPNQIAKFKKHYDPELVEALLTRAGDIDLRAAFHRALTIVLDQAGASPFDKLALGRRTQEGELLKHEVRMFEEMANLMSKITTRYSVLTGLPETADRGEEPSDA